MSRSAYNNFIHTDYLQYEKSLILKSIDFSIILRSFFFLFYITQHRDEAENEQKRNIIKKLQHHHEMIEKRKKTEAQHIAQEKENVVVAHKK